MKYYRALKEKHDWFTGYTTIPGELITEKERNTKFRYLQDIDFQLVEINRKNIYWSFGARFENGTTYRDFTSEKIYREINGKIQEV